MFRLKRLFSILFIILSLQVMGMSAKQPMEGIEVGNFAPKFTLYDLDGKSYSSDAYRGKLILLNFWATWCPACKYEKPFLEDVYKKYRDDGLVVLKVSLDQSKRTLKNYLAENPMDIPVFYDNGDLANKFLIKAFPTTYIIDKNGVIIGKQIGALKWNEFDFSKFL